MDSFTKTVEVKLPVLKKGSSGDSVMALQAMLEVYGYVTVEELEDLDLMHEVYHNKEKLGGNGFLDALMKTVHALEVRV